jgi:hypothetical protein
MTYAPMSREEEEEKQEALAEVSDPMFLMREDLDAEGEVDGEFEMNDLSKGPDILDIKDEPMS